MISLLRAAARRMRGWEAALAAAGAAGLFVVVYAREVLAPYWRGPRAGRPPWEHFGDQALYLKSALAFASLDLDPSRHHYPPLYALVAAPFAGVFPADPFVFVNLVSVAGSAALLVTLFGGLIGRSAAALCALGFLLLPGLMLETFAVPWTSTLATLLAFLALWRLARLETARRPPPKESFIFSFLLGMIVPTRPLDAVAVATLYPFWLARLWRSDDGRSAGLPPRRMGPHIGALLAGGLLGPMILVGVNLTVYGRPASPYVRGFGGSDVFSWATFPEKFVSIFLDSASLYVEPGQVVLGRFPWMLTGFLALAACLALGRPWLRAGVVAALLQIGMYVAFDDLLPNGLYRYYNYHYFRWAFWLAFMMLPASAILAHRRFGARLWLPMSVALASAVALGCLQFHMSETDVPATARGDRIEVTLPGRRIDYVDLAGLTADWATAYFPGQDIWIDGRRPPFVHARFLQTATGTRLLFVRPVHGGTVELSAPQWRGAVAAARVGTRGFALGFPSWLSERPASLPPGVPLRLDGLISHRVFEAGFRDFDGRGRPMAGCQAVLALALPLDASRYRLDLRFWAAEPATLMVGAGGSASPDRSVEIGRGESNLSIPIPQAAGSRRAMTRVRLGRQGCLEGQPVPDIAVLRAALERDARDGHTS
jgi:hypothetical protein